jgi:hypothetical protein
LLVLWPGTPGFAAAVGSEVPASDEALDFAQGGHKRFAERVNAAQKTDYQAVLAAYDARRETHPHDVVSCIERCRFIETFATLEEPTIESASDDLEACRQQLSSGPHATNVEVILYGVESSWSDEDTKAAQDLLPKSRSWTKGQRATLYELLAIRHRWSDETRAASYAIQAVDLNPGSSVLLMAVHRWVQLGGKDKARRILFEAPASTWERVSRTEAAQVLIDLGDAAFASRLLRDASADERQPGSDLALARALTAGGDFAAARQWYRDALARDTYIGVDTRVEYFDFERQHGTRQDAAAAYDQLRKAGFAADSLARHRLGLLLAWPGLAWQWRDLLGVLALLGTALAFGLVPLLFIFPVHYRGLALRASGRAPSPGMAPWSLREAWYAATAFTLAGFAALYVFATPYLEARLPLTNRISLSPAPDRVLAKVLLWSIVGALVLLIPLLRGRSVRSLLCGSWPVKRSVLVGIGAALLLKTVAGILTRGFRDLGVLGSDTTRSMQGADEAYGLWGLLLLVAVATPAVEELVFRGVLLGAFRGHVSFLFATLVQATVFTLVHEEWQSMPFLFVFALTAAWLAKRSEGLLAPMVMHGVNNAMACLAVVRATQVLNQ